MAGMAYHCYAGTVGAMSTFRNAHPTSGIWFSESCAHFACSTLLTGHAQCKAECAGTVGSDWWEDLKWQTSNLWVGAPNNWARSALMWSFAADSNGVRRAIALGTETITAHVGSVTSRF